MFVEYSDAALVKHHQMVLQTIGGGRGNGSGMFNDYENYIQSQWTNEERSQLDIYLEETPRKMNDD